MCIFSRKPVCKFPCRVCKLCWEKKGCMGCINQKKKYTKICNW